MIEKIDGDFKEIKSSLKCILADAKEFSDREGFKFTVINEWDDEYRHLTVEMKIPRTSKFNIEDIINEAKNNL